MAKVESSKSHVKHKDNQKSFVKNRAGFHPESDEELRAFAHPGQPEHDYEEFRKAQGEGNESAEGGKARKVKGESASVISNIFTLLKHPGLTIRAITDRI